MNQRFSTMSEPNEIVVIDGKVEKDDIDPRQLQRIERTNDLGRSIPLCRTSSHIHLPRQHLPIQSEIGIPYMRTFDDDMECDYLPEYYRTTDRESIPPRSFVGNPPYNPSWKEASGLPPRPPSRYHSSRMDRLSKSVPLNLPEACNERKSLTSHQRGKSYIYRQTNEEQHRKYLCQTEHRSCKLRHQLQKSSSLSMISYEDHPRLIEHNSSGLERGDISNAKKFSPKRSKSIYRGFDKQKVFPKCDGDVWVERIVVDGTTGRKKTYFKSVFGNVVSNEPPTGASTILYLEDIIDRRRPRPPGTKRPSKLNQGKSTMNQLKHDEHENAVTETETGYSHKNPPGRRKSFFRFIKKAKN